MQSYIFLGPPASGKGTQAKALAKTKGLVYFGSGDLMREEIKKRTSFGQIFRAVLNNGQGKLVDDRIALDFVKTKLDEIGRDKGFVFDGFPRTIEQAEFLDQKLNHQLKVFNIVVSDDAVVERSATRRVCENCGKIYFKPKPNKRHCDECGSELIRRSEDAPEVVKKRLAIYKQLTQPLIDYYAKKNILVNIDGEPNIEEVGYAVKAKVDEQ